MINIIFLFFGLTELIVLLIAFVYLVSNKKTINIEKHRQQIIIFTCFIYMIPQVIIYYLIGQLNTLLCIYIIFSTLLLGLALRKYTKWILKRNCTGKFDGVSEIVLCIYDIIDMILQLLK
jgi:Mn2+/Fe2+ NRAMP family transporter